jgi:hypothetical protein
MRIVREDCDKTSLASRQPASEVRHHPALRKFSNFADGSLSTPHRDRVFGGAKRIVVRGGCRLKAVVYWPKPGHTTLRCRWWAGRQRDIIVDKGLPLL